MPGHIIEAKCDCGYEKTMMPGAGGIDLKNYVMAYSENGRTLNTYEKEKAEHQGLTIIRDPFLDDFIIDDNAIEDVPLAKNRTILECPRCNKHSLHLKLSGLWD